VSGGECCKPVVLEQTGARHEWCLMTTTSLRPPSWADQVVEGDRRRLITAEADQLSGTVVAPSAIDHAAAQRLGCQAVGPSSPFRRSTWLRARRPELVGAHGSASGQRHGPRRRRPRWNVTDMRSSRNWNRGGASGGGSEAEAA